MASFVAAGNSCWAPNPLPERGASFSINSNAQGTQICYGSGYSVVLRDVSNPEMVKVYTAHKKFVRTANFTPDGKHVASGDLAGVVRVFEAGHPDLKTKKEIPILGGAINDISFDASGKRMAVCGDAKGNNARVLMWESGSAQGEVAVSPKRCLSIALRPSDPCRLATASEDMKVRLHNGPPFKFSHSFDQHKNFVQCVRYSPCGSFLATAGSDKMIYLLDGESGTLKTSFDCEHKGSVYAVSWSDDAKTLMSVSGDKTCKLWDVNTGKCIETITVGKDILDMQVGCCFAGSQPITLSLSGDINYMDFNSGKIAKMVQAHTSTPVSICRDWANDGNEVYVGTMDGDVFGYMPDGTAARFEGGKPGSNDGVVCHKGVLHSAGHDDVLRSAKVGNGSFQFNSSTTPISGTPLTIDSCPSDPNLVVTCTETHVYLSRDGRVTDTKEVSGYTATCVAMAVDGSEIMVGGSDKAGHVFTISGDKLTPTGDKCGGLQGPPSAIAYSPSGKHVAIGDQIKEITLWDTSSRECLIKNKWVFHQSRITTLCFSPDGQYLASGAGDTQLIIWNTEKKMKKTKIFPAHALGVLSVAWLDGKTVISGGGDGCIRKWTPDLP